MMADFESHDAGILLRVWRFLRKPWPEKKKSFYFRWRSIFPNTPAPLRLPFGAWWLVRSDNAGLPISEGRFESAELGFVDRFVRPGMTALDIGAHHGLYTLLLSKKIGASGRVFSFEPSPREGVALRKHLKLNRCRNVAVEELAVGDENKEGQLHVVEGFETGCNSLRPPIVMSETSPVCVCVRRLDDWVSERRLDAVDFIKLDVEGGELAALRGASRFLERRPRPVILVEVQDVRTQPWGYRAKDILLYLASRDFRWFRLLEGGIVELLDLSPESFEGNFVAWPSERGLPAYAKCSE
jgi:FkbM family methyltransferase